MERKLRKDVDLVPESNDISYIQRELLRWFDKHKRIFPWRMVSTSEYEQIVSELLLQRTRAETVASFFPEFIRDFPSWHFLARASELQLQLYLQPIGLWRRRAKSMNTLAKEMVTRGGRFPNSREALEELPGVGQYIASSILLFCHRQPAPLLDSNMARVLERIYGPRQYADIRFDPELQTSARQIVNCDRAVDINWAILDLAAMVCRIRMPRCDICPISNCCSYCTRQK